MTRAESMRAVSTKALEEQREKTLKKHTKYVNKLIAKNIRRSAEKGRVGIKIKIGTRYSPTMVVEQLESKGFNISQSRSNGRTVLGIKW